MRNATRCRWQQWRLCLSDPLNSTTARFTRRPLASAATPTPPTEKPGPDGIRHQLVERIRREIAAGIYDTDEKWQEAEERLLQKAERMA